MRKYEEPVEEGIEADEFLENGNNHDDPEVSRMSASAGPEGFRWQTEGWACRPYNREVINKEIDKANRRGEKGHAAIVKFLKSKGIRVFVVDAKHAPTVADIMSSVRGIIHFVVTKSREPSCFGRPHQGKRCLLYKDKHGRFFNLTMADYTASAAGTFRSYLDSFSGVQAMCILLILARSLPCATDTSSIADEFRPAYLGVLLGLVFTEEISFSWIYSSIFVRGLPSISAYTIVSNSETDWSRKILLFTLYLSGATSGQTQAVLTLIGISMACMILLANLGSRAWMFMGWRPIPNVGFFTPFLAYVSAVTTGLAIPYLGHREMQVAGKTGLEKVMKHALIAAAVFVVSDYDDFQEFLVIGSKNCEQDYVNIAVGAWWAISLIVCLCLIRYKSESSNSPADEEPDLEEDHTSPVGFKVPTLPDFPVDPIFEQRSLPCINVSIEFFACILVALGGGVGIVYLAFTSFDDDIADGF